MATKTPTPLPPRAGTTRTRNQPPPATAPPQTFTVGETDEREVKKPDGGQGDRPYLSVPDVEDTGVARPSAVYKGVTLKDIAGEDEERDEAHKKGYGPPIVILHDGVTGAGTRGLGALSRGRVVNLSRLVGDELMEAGNEVRLRAALRHYMRPDDPAIRDATVAEAQFDKILFAENEEEALEALEVSQNEVAQRDAEIQRLSNLVRSLGHDPDADVSAIASEGLDNSFEGQGASEVEVQTQDTGESLDPGARDPSFVKQGAATTAEADEFDTVPTDEEADEFPQ